MIHRQNHEVACHGLTHTLVYQQTPDEFKSETLQAKQLLEDLIGSPVQGYRAASYSITRRSFWALDVLVEAGFAYDSSIFPVRHDLYGVPNSETRPHRLETSRGSQIVEFPPTTVRMFGTNLPVGGGGYFRLYPYWLTRYLLSRLNRKRGESFVFYVHPWEIDADQPRVDVGWRSRFRHYSNLDKTEERLRQLLKDFKFTTVRTVLQGLGLLRS